MAREGDNRLRALQQAARALRQAEATSQWVRILDASAAPFPAFTAFFRVGRHGILCEAARGNDGAVLPGHVSLDDSPAFRQAIETRETVVCVITAAQLSAPVAAMWAGKKAHLFPLNGKTRVLGVMLAAGDTGVD